MKCMSVKKPCRKEVFWDSEIQLNMVLSPIGTIWRKSGITLSIVSLRSHRKSIQSLWLRPHWIQKRTERRWPKSCLRSLMCHVSMLVSKQYWLFIQMVEPPVSFLTLEMVYPIPYPSMKVMLSLMLYRESILQEETSQAIFRSCLMRGVIHSPLMQKSRSSKILRKECVL